MNVRMTVIHEKARRAKGGGLRPVVGLSGNLNVSFIVE
jgi:hypothetical protein